MRSVEAVLPDQAMPDQATSDQAMSGTQAFSNWMEGLSSQELRRAQIEDPNIGIVINWLEHSYEPTTRELQLTGPETRAVWLNRDFLKLQDGILFYSLATLKTAMTAWLFLWSSGHEYYTTRMIQKVLDI